MVLGSILGQGTSHRFVTLLSAGKHVYVPAWGLTKTYMENKMTMQDCYGIFVRFLYDKWLHASTATCDIYSQCSASNPAPDKSCASLPSDMISGILEENVREIGISGFLDILHEIKCQTTPVKKHKKDANLIQRCKTTRLQSDMRAPLQFCDDVTRYKKFLFKSDIYNISTLALSYFNELFVSFCLLGH